DLGGAFDATSIDGCRPGKFVIGVTKRLLQHNLPDNGLRTSRGRCPLGAEFVAKVENRTTLKISRKSIFGLLCCCATSLGHVCTAPWQELSHFSAALVGCGHVSGLLMRR